MERADIGLFSIVLAIQVISYISLKIGVERRERLKVKKYRFYKVRDELISLVAMGKLQESEETFRLFYETTHYLIKNVNVITLRSFVSGVRAARKKGLDPTAGNVLEEIKRALSHKEELVRETILSFFAAVMQTLVESSLLLRILVWTSDFTNRPWVRATLKLAAKILKPQKQGWEIYQNSSQAQQILQGI